MNKNEYTDTKFNNVYKLKIHSAILNTFNMTDFMVPLIDFFFLPVLLLHDVVSVLTFTALEIISKFYVQHAKEEVLS